MISRDTFSVRGLNPNTGVLIHSHNIKNYIALDFFALCSIAYTGNS